MHPEPYDLTPQDVAEQLGAARQTVSRWARKGYLPYLETPGGWKRFRQSDVDTFLDNLKHETTAS